MTTKIPLLVIMGAALAISCSAQTWVQECDGATNCPIAGDVYPTVVGFIENMPWNNVNNEFLLYLASSNDHSIYSNTVWGMYWTGSTYGFRMRVNNAIPGPTSCGNQGGMVNPALGHPNGAFGFDSTHGLMFMTEQLCANGNANFTTTIPASTWTPNALSSSCPNQSGCGNYTTPNWPNDSLFAQYVPSYGKFIFCCGTGSPNAFTLLESSDALTWTSLGGSVHGADGPLCNSGTSTNCIPSSILTDFSAITDGTYYYAVAGCNGTIAGNISPNLCNGNGNINEVWRYDPVNKVMTKMVPAGGTKPPNTYASHPFVAYDTDRGRILWYADTGALWAGAISGTNITWTTVAVGGTAPNFTATVLGIPNVLAAANGNLAGYDPINHNFVMWSGSAQTNPPLLWYVNLGAGSTGASGQFRILSSWPSGNAKWVKACGLASMSAGGTATVTLNGAGSGIPLSVLEALYPGDPTGHTGTIPSGGIARTAEPFCNGIPISDTVGLTSTSALSISGTIAAGTSNLATNNQNCAAGGDTNRIAVNTGTMCVEFKKNNHNGPDVVTVGATSVVTTGTQAARGFVIVGPDPTQSTTAGKTACSPDTGGSTCATVYSSANDSTSTCVIDAGGADNGPVLAAIKCDWTYYDAGAVHPYGHGTVRYYLYYGKNYIRYRVARRNADWDQTNPQSTDAVGNTFNSAYKGARASELRIPVSTATGSITSKIGTATAVQTTTFNTSSATDGQYIVQGQSQNMIGNQDCGFLSTCANLYSTDQGYTVRQNVSGTGTTQETGTSTQYPVGYMDCSNSSGLGIDFGIFQMATYFPKSLECDVSSSALEIRFGLWPSENGNQAGGPGNGTQAVYDPWPDWRIFDGWMEFHTSAPTSISNDFLQYQHPLLAEASVAYYNGVTGTINGGTVPIFPYPMPNASDEDTFLLNAAATAVPSKAATTMCTPGAAPCLQDMGVVSAFWPMTGMRYWTWGNSGATSNSGDRRWSDILNFFKRGQLGTGRYLNSIMWFKRLAEDGWSHSDGTASTDKSYDTWKWASRPVTPISEVDSFYYQAAVDNQSADSTNQGIGVAISSITNSSKNFNDMASKDSYHMHIDGVPDGYFITTDEFLKDALVSLKTLFVDTRSGLNSHYYNIGGGTWAIRAVGIYLKNQARMAEYFQSIGDADYTTMLANGAQQYTDFVTPDYCIRDGSGNTWPSGCSPDPISNLLTNWASLCTQGGIAGPPCPVGKWNAIQDANTNVWEAQNRGWTGITAPTFPASPTYGTTTVTDGSVTWLARYSNASGAVHAGYDQVGVSKVLGIASSTTSNGQGWCNTNSGLGIYTYRGNDLLQYDLLNEGSLYLRRVKGPTWGVEYNNSLSLAYGISSWGLTEHMNWNGGSSYADSSSQSTSPAGFYLYNGPQPGGVIMDVANQCDSSKGIGTAGNNTSGTLNISSTANGDGSYTATFVSGFPISADWYVAVLRITSGGGLCKLIPAPDNSSVKLYNYSGCAPPPSGNQAWTGLWWGHGNIGGIYPDLPLFPNGHYYDQYTLAGGNQSHWGIWWTQYLVNGKLTSEQNIKLNINAQWLNTPGEGAFFDVASYKLAAAIYAYTYPGTNVLKDVLVTVTPTGGGNYNLTWTPPAGVTQYRLKWCCAAPYGAKTIINSGGFSTVSSPTPQLGGLMGYDHASTLNFAVNPATNMTWFGANSLTPSAEPAVGASSISVSTGVTGLTSINFSLKAMAPLSQGPTELGGAFSNISIGGMVR